MFGIRKIEMKVAKILLSTMLSLIATLNLAAQCPDENDLFNFYTNSTSWSFCENEGITNLEQFIQNGFPIGTFTSNDPAMATALIGNVFDPSQAPIGGIGFNVEYEMNINGTSCIYNLTLSVIPQSPELDLNTINLNSSYCEEESAFGITVPTVTIDVNGVSQTVTPIVSINGDNTIPPVYDPSVNNGTTDTIVYIYGFGCVTSDTVFVNVNETPQINNTEDTLFTDQLAYVLEADPAGGDFFLNGTQLTNDTIDVSTLTAGTNISIGYNDPNGCEAEPETFVIAEPPLILPPDTGNIAFTNIFIPNVFTPNEDQLNDIVYVRADSLFSLNFKIFDRWGAKVFETEDQNTGWDGYDGKGQKLNAGIYFYQLLYKTEEEGAEQLKKGDINLIR